VTAGTTRSARTVGRVTPRTRTEGPVLAGWLSSTDHKVIGHMYLVTSFVPAACQNGAETTDIER
jgi:cytochrome c oxidase subunit 1